MNSRRKGLDAAEHRVFECLSGNQRAARLLGVQAQLLDVRNSSDLRRAFEGAIQQRVDGIVVGADGLIQAHQKEIVDWVARSRLPAVYPARDFVESGGLMAYAVSYPICIFGSPITSTRSSKAALPATSPSSSRPGSNW